MGFLDTLLPNRQMEAAELLSIESRTQAAETIATQQVQIQEASSQLEVLNRQVEDLQWRLISQDNDQIPGDKELSLERRQDRNKQTERMFREDALIRRAVNLSSEYVWGRGMQKPSARDPRVQRVIDSFWSDTNNKKALIDLQAQIDTNTDLELHGELFFLIFDDGRWKNLGIEVTDIQGEGTSGLQDTTLPQGIESMIREGNFEYTEDLSGGKYTVEVTGPLPESAVKLSKVHPNEITHVIRDTKSSLITRYYKRERVPGRFDFTKGEPAPAVNSRGQKVVEVTYYEDFETPPPDDYDNIAPVVGKGRILHVAINKSSSHALRGNSDAWVAIRWARLLNDYFEWRVTLLRAWATFPFKRKIKGGMSQVLQAAQRMGNSQVLPGSGTPGSLDARGVPAQGSVLTENEAESLEQFKTTSGSAEAEQDILALRSQAGLAMGLPPSYLGGPMDNLNNSTALEFPVLKRFSMRQELFEQLVQKILDHAIMKAVEEGLIPEDADLTYKNDLPSILERNIPELVNSINQIAARLDPFSINFKLKRFLLLYGLQVMGVNNPQKIVADIYPPGAEDEERQKMAELTTGIASGTAPESSGASQDATLPASDLDPLKNKKQQAQQESAVDDLYDDVEFMSTDGYAQYMLGVRELINKMEEFGRAEIERTRV